MSKITRHIINSDGDFGQNTLHPSIAQWDTESKTLYIRLSFYEAVLLDETETKGLIKLIQQLQAKGIV